VGASSTAVVVVVAGATIASIIVARGGWEILRRIDGHWSLACVVGSLPTSVSCLASSTICALCNGVRWHMEALVSCLLHVSGTYFSKFTFVKVHLLDTIWHLNRGLVSIHVSYSSSLTLEGALDHQHPFVK